MSQPTPNYRAYLLIQLDTTGPLPRVESIFVTNCPGATMTVEIGKTLYATILERSGATYEEAYERVVGTVFAEDFFEGLRAGLSKTLGENARFVKEWNEGA